MKPLVAVTVFVGFLCGSVLGTTLQLWGDFRERVTYAELIDEKNALAAEVEQCRRATVGLGTRIAALENRPRRRR